MVAKKSEFFRQGQAIRGDFDRTGRQSSSLPATLYLIRLRAVPLKIPIPKELKEPRKITIEIEIRSLSPEAAKTDVPA